MDMKFEPQTLSGSIPAIPSKSDAHRILICAALSDRETRIHLEKSSVDIDTTIGCLSALGAGFSRDGDYLTVTPVKKIDGVPTLDCMESGSTFRFMLPVACALYEKVNFTGSGRLPSRPISDLSDEMKKHGVKFSNPTLPFTTEGLMSGGEFTLPGNVSSQYITGLLLALPMTKEGGRISLTTKLESAPYVDITISALERFGVDVKRGENSFCVSPSDYKAMDSVAVEGDWSNAAFFLSAAAISGSLTVTNLDVNSPQGDRVILQILKNFGADVSVLEKCVTICHKDLSGIVIDVSEAPDLLPVLTVVAAYAKGETKFINARRLRLKESDRIVACHEMLKNLGISSVYDEDSMTVTGGTVMGGVVDSFNDHRIVMSAGVAATKAKGSITVTGAQAVNKSYPGFSSDYNILGGKSSVI